MLIDNYKKEIVVKVCSGNKYRKRFIINRLIYALRKSPLTRATCPVGPTRRLSPSLILSSLISFLQKRFSHSFFSSLISFPSAHRSHGSHRRRGVLLLPCVAATPAPARQRSTPLLQTAVASRRYTAAPLQLRRSSLRRRCSALHRSFCHGRRVLRRSIRCHRRRCNGARPGLQWNTAEVVGAPPWLQWSFAGAAVELRRRLDAASQWLDVASPVALGEAWCCNRAPAGGSIAAPGAASQCSPAARRSVLVLL